MGAQLVIAASLALYTINTPMFSIAAIAVGSHTCYNCTINFRYKTNEVLSNIPKKSIALTRFT